jgi:hypothetical protein
VFRLDIGSPAVHRRATAEERKMMRRGKRLGVGIAAAAAVSAMGLVAGGPASAHKVRYDANLQLRIEVLNDTQDTFSGKIESQRDACERGRTINVTHAGVTIATAITDLAGNWTVVGPRPPKRADVTAFTPKKVLKKNRKHRHRCAAEITTRKAP